MPNFCDKVEVKLLTPSPGEDGVQQMFLQVAE